MCSLEEVTSSMRALAMRQSEHSNWSLVLTAVSDIKEEYDTLMQVWPWSTLPYRDDLVTAATHVSQRGAAALILDDEMEAERLDQVDLRAGWRAVSQQFEQVLALGEHGSASSGAMAHSTNDCGWVGRLFFAHDHCLLIGGRLDGRRPRESTLVCISRGGHAVPPHAHSAVEICLETLAMKQSEVRWRRQGAERCAFVSLSAPNAALCIGAPNFQALVSCSVELSSCLSDVDGRRHGDTSGCRDKSALVIRPIPAGTGKLRLRLRALAPWVTSTAAAKIGTAAGEPSSYLVQITTTSGLRATPHQATLPATVTLSLADNVCLPAMRSGRTQMLTVAGRGVLTMRRKIDICD